MAYSYYIKLTFRAIRWCIGNKKTSGGATGAIVLHVASGGQMSAAHIALICAVRVLEYYGYLC